MAIVTILAGGFIGVLAAFLALMLGSGMLAALSLWVSVAVGSSLIAGLFALLPRRNPQVVRA